MPIPAYKLLVLGAVALSLTACPGPCADEDLDDPIEYDGGINPDPNSYLSSSLDGPYLHFPPGRKYQLRHDLGEPPVTVNAYLAFDERGAISQSAGKQAILGWNDTFVMVSNETCAEFYVLVTATTTSEAVSLDGGAGGDGGSLDGG